MADSEKSEAKEFLLSEYKYLCDSLWKNEETGEKRVQFFLTLVTAVLAATAALVSKAVDPDQPGSNLFYGISIFALAGLMVFGVITLLRILKRNAATDEYKLAIDDIRERFRDFFDPRGVLSGYEPFMGASKEKYSLRKMGGLSHIVAGLNSIIAAALTALILLMINACAGCKPAGATGTLLGIGFAAFCIFMAVQCYFIRRSDRQKKSDMAASGVTRAGGIVRRKNGEEDLFLIVTAKKDPSRPQASPEWVLPKGHIEGKGDPKPANWWKKWKDSETAALPEKKEDPAAAALREVEEEAGVKGRICGTVGYSKYKVGEEVVYVKFYLMEYEGDAKGIKSEEREKQWRTFDDAISLLSHEESRTLLRHARFMLSEERRDSRGLPPPDYGRTPWRRLWRTLWGQ